MPRLLFEKRGNAVWISHLDLMRLFQRAFKRAELPLTHTQGFNPRPSVSIALPLSVGIESCCELLDFELDGDKISCAEMKDRLNKSLISGIKVLDVYDSGSKIKNLAFLNCTLVLEYDGGVSENMVAAIRALFSQPEVLVEKKSKNGVSEQNIVTMIRTLSVDQADADTIRLDARICCQNPALNPMQLHGAICRYLPELAPDHVTCSRRELYDTNNERFR